MTTRFAPRILMMTAVASSLLLSGCAADGRVDKEAMGTLLGGAAGAWAGSSVGRGGGKAVAIGVGTMLGAVVGNSIGK